LEHIIRVPFVSLVNLIAGKGVVKELIMEEVTVDNVVNEMKKLIEPVSRENILSGYKEIINVLGKEPASDKAAKSLYADLCKKK